MKTFQPVGLIGRTGAALALLSLVLISGSRSAAMASDGIMLLDPCPGKPNCVCSDDPDPDRWVQPFALAVAPEAAWASLNHLVASLPRVAVAKVTDKDLHAEAKSSLFGFVDDLAFQLRPGQKIIAVRSASRSGYFDFGVNRKRVENIREQLRVMGVVE